MNQKISLAICTVGILAVGGYLILKGGSSYDKSDVLAVYEAAPCHESENSKKKEELTKKLRSSALAKSNTEVGDATIIKYQESPAQPLFNAPCPISERIQSEIVQRSLPISFKKEKNYRQWLGIVKSIEDPRPLTAINEKIRSLIIVLIKLEAPNVFHLFGTSEAGDLAEMTRIAISLANTLAIEA